MTSAYGLDSLSSASVRDLYARLEASPALLETYYWNMKAQSHRAPPCSTDLCRAKTLCSLKWWTTKGEYLACVDGAKTTSTLVNTITSKRGSGTALPPSDVYVAIFMTVFATVVVMGLIVTVMRGLRRSGVLKTSEQREDREKENFFPML